MGKHAEWRKQAKKQRRKCIRQKLAAARDEKLKKENEKREKSPRYQQWLAEQEALRLFEEQEEQRLAKEREQQWFQREREAQKKWEELQLKLAHVREERRKQEERIKREWQEEQRLIKEAKEKQEKEREEKEKHEQLVQERIEEFISNNGPLPEELKANIESNPGKDTCPFFTKVGVCRFGDGCSRNHIRPTISTILLFPGFYTHISLEQSNESEYGSDSMLEYDDTERHNHFCEFFEDVLPELQKCGCIIQFRVCSNKEAHLRGNVYVEYMSARDAVKAYRIFQGRWYGGKQINVEFCNIPSWKAAICGLSFKQRCPKGSSCNFLHVFRNPGRMFEDINFSVRSQREERRFSGSNDSARSWRWSITPEREIKTEEEYHKKRKRSSDNYENHDRSRHRNKHSDYKSRSRSKDRHASKSQRSRSPHYHRKENHKRESRKKHCSKERTRNEKY